MPNKRLLASSVIPAQLAPDVWQVSSPIPEGQLTHTLTYVLRGSAGELHLVDPGWGSDENLAALEASLGELGFRLGDVTTVVATHHHPDHLGIAARVRQLTGARVVMSATEAEVLRLQLSPEAGDRAVYEGRLDAWGVPHNRRPELREQYDRPAWLEPTEPDRAVVDGELLELGGHDLRVVLTPGHTSGHLCLVDDARGLIYTGDHVLPHIFAGVGIGVLPGTRPLADYLASLRILEPYDGLRVLPGHGQVFSGLGERRRTIARHHLRRTQEVHGLLDSLGDAPVWEYTRSMTWTGGWEGLQGFWLHSALNQTQMHLEVARSSGIDELLSGD